MSDDDAAGGGHAQDQGRGRVISDFLKAIVQGYLAPRRSAREILSRRPDPRAIVLLLLLAYLVGQILAIATPGGDVVLEGGFVARHVGQLMQFSISFFLFVGMVYGVGRMMGGQGTVLETSAIVSWHALVTSFLTPLKVIFFREVLTATAVAEAGGTPEISPGIAFMGMFVGLTVLWLLANYVAELHRFKKVMGVLGVMLGLIVAILFVFSSIMGGAG